MEIRQIVQKLHDEYEQKYKEWCLANPGKVMCNYGTKAWILNTILIDDLDLEGIKYKEKWYRERYEQENKHSYIPAEVLKELIDIIDIENE